MLVFTLGQQLDVVAVMVVMDFKSGLVLPRSSVPGPVRRLAAAGPSSVWSLSALYTSTALLYLCFVPAPLLTPLLIARIFWSPHFLRRLHFEILCLFIEEEADLY